MLAYSLGQNERLAVCDAFDRPTDEPYRNRPTRDILWTNLLSVVPSLRRSQVWIFRGYSRDLVLDGHETLRFVHIDGGHSYDAAISDLRLVADRVMRHGVIAVDDYENRIFPEVTRAVHDFLGSRVDYRVLADLNRYGAIGRKIYLVRNGATGVSS